MLRSYTGYESLEAVLQAALDQAAAGKGKERHAQDRPLAEQPMQVICGLLGTHDGLLYQAMKKLQESKRMPTDRAIAELLGAIVYTAGAIVYLQGKQDEEPSDSATGLTSTIWGGLADAGLANISLQGASVSNE